MVSCLRKEIEYKMGKLEYKKVGSHVAEDQQHLLTVVIDLYSLSFISEGWEEGLNREEGLLTFRRLSQERGGGGGLIEGGGLFEGGT